MWIFFLIAAAAGVYLLAKKEEGTGTGAGGGTDPGRLGTTDTSSHRAVRKRSMPSSHHMGRHRPRCCRSDGGRAHQEPLSCHGVAPRRRQSKAASSLQPTHSASAHRLPGRRRRPTFGVDLLRQLDGPEAGWELAPLPQRPSRPSLPYFPTSLSPPVACSRQPAWRQRAKLGRACLASFDGWKRDPLLVKAKAQLPVLDSDNLRSKASIIETTYGANAGGRLRIASAVDEAASRAAILDRGARQSCEQNANGRVSWLSMTLTFNSMQRFRIGLPQDFETITGSCGKGFLGIAAAACADTTRFSRARH